MRHALICILSVMLHCPAQVAAPAAIQPAPVVTAAASTCTITRVPNGTCADCVDLVLGPTCTAADLFVNAVGGDFHVSAIDSPQVNNATCTAEVLTDFDGNARPSPGRGCDVGAFQFVGATPPPPPPAPSGLQVIGVKP